MIHYLIVQMSCKNNCGRFYQDLTLKPSRPVSISHLRLKFILEEWINKQIRKAIQALRNVIKGLHADLRGKYRGKSHFNYGAVLGFTEGFTCFSSDLTKKYVYLVMSTYIKLVKKLLCAYSWLLQRSMLI